MPSHKDITELFMSEKILITGASGFIGGFIVEEALKHGMETWAAVRRGSSRKYLQDERIRFIELDFSDESALQKQLTEHAFDYIVHSAGVTKCLHKDDFYKVNTLGTINFVNAIMATEMPIKKFVYISSLSVFGAIKERQPYSDINNEDIPHPNTEYGRSKLKAERFLETAAKALPYVILRPTGVYGPREKDYFLMAKSIKNHVDFAVGYKRQDITFVYVKDVVQAVFLSLTKGKNAEKYFLTDGGVYSSSTFSNLIRASLGNPFCLRVKVPLWVLRAITLVSETLAMITSKVSALNSDKYNILKQRNWRCDISNTIEGLGYEPTYDLARGVKETIDWYKENKWL